jgi:hypothetical protein
MVATGRGREGARKGRNGARGSREGGGSKFFVTLHFDPVNYFLEYPEHVRKLRRHEG